MINIPTILFSFTTVSLIILMKQTNQLMNDFRHIIKTLIKIKFNPEQEQEKEKIIEELNKIDWTQKRNRRKNC